jgi:IPT/TIG domain-containing protein
MDRWLVIAFVLLTLASGSSIVVFPAAMAQFAYVVPIMFLFIAIGAFLLLLLHYAYTLLGVKKDLAIGALGLPEGSIRAFLTIGLLVLVAVFGTFIYFESGKSATYTIVRADVPVASPEELAALIKSVGDKFIVIPKGKTADVVSSTPDTTRADVAKQLLTMIATALTTVIGFYFGTSAATAGAAAASGAGGGSVAPPAPITFDPSSGRPGDPVKISGSGLGSEKGTVSFGDVPADMTSAKWADSEVTVNVPAAAKPGKVKVTLVPARTERKLVSSAEFEVLERGASSGTVDEQNSVDGCDVAITDATKDRDLPAADGGLQR